MIFSRSCKNLVMMCVLFESTITIVLSTGGVRAASFSSCSPWTVVSSPNPALIDNVLAAVTALSPTDVWAVGFDDRGTLTEHWDGAIWSVVPSPSVGKAQIEDNILSAVTATSAQDVWAAGMKVVEGSKVPRQTLILHWDGKSWHVMDSPNGSQPNNELFGIAAISTGDVWAVGDMSSDTTPPQPLTEHWNGRKWSTITSPTFAGGAVLSGVASLSPDSVWAVGTFKDSRNLPNTLTEQWDGASLSVVASPSPFVQGNTLSAVAVVPGTQSLWSVGYGVDQFDDFRTLTESYCV